MRGYKAERLLGASALGLLILTSAANAASVTIDFDVLADGTPLAAQTTFALTPGPLREEYRAAGVHFRGGGGVLTGNPGVAGISSPNYLMFNARPMAVYQDGSPAAPPETIMFDQPADLVKVNVGSFEGGTATLTAYDAGGNSLGTAALPLSAGLSPLQVQSSSYNIASVQLVLTGSRSMVADDLVFVIQDHTNAPPVTVCELSGTPGANGWYVGEVTATLSATDADDTVAATRCRLDGGDWQPYSAPVVVSGDGTHTLDFQSMDSQGLWEDAQSESVKIDVARPSVKMQLTPPLLWAVHEPKQAVLRKKLVVNDLAPVVVNGSAADPVSGVADVTFTVTDEYGEVQPPLSDFGQTLLLPAVVKPHHQDHRWYRVTATVTNNAGLTASTTGWVWVLPGAPGHNHVLRELARLSQSMRAPLLAGGLVSGSPR